MSDPRFPNRPKHPDFMKLSEIIIAQDKESESGLDPIVERIVDPESLAYMATQRVLRLISLGLLDPSGLAGLWVDAFIAGAEYQKRKL